MRMLCALVLGTVLSTGLSADPAKNNCLCKAPCQCTQEKHCGCMDQHNKTYQDEGYMSCKCGKGCNCGR